MEPPPRINPPVGLPGDELDIAVLAARRRALRLAKKGPQPAATRSAAEAALQPSAGTQTLPIARASQGSAAADVRARSSLSSAAERPLTAAGALQPAQPGIERSANGAITAAEADLPTDPAAAEALSELPRDAAESVIVAEEQRSTFKRQQAAAVAAAAQQSPAAPQPADSDAAPRDGAAAEEEAGAAAGDSSIDSGNEDPAAAALRAPPLGPVRTKLSADGWLQSRLAELEHRVDSLGAAATDQSNAPFASLSLPYGVGLGSTSSAVPTVGSSDAPLVGREGAGEAHRAIEDRHAADGASAALQQASSDGTEMPTAVESEDGILTASEAGAEAADAGDSSALGADAGATDEAATASDLGPDGAVEGSGSHDLLRPVRRITGVVPRFLRQQWQQMRGGDRSLAFTTVPATAERAAEKQDPAPQQLAKQLGEVCLSAAPHEVLLPEVSAHGRAMFGPLRRVRPRTAAARSQSQARQAPARVDAAVVQGVQRDTGPVRLQQFCLTSPTQQERSAPRVLAAPAITQRLALEPAWGAGAQPESPPKFSQQRRAA